MPQMNRPSYGQIFASLQVEGDDLVEVFQQILSEKKLQQAKQDQ